MIYALIVNCPSFTWILSKDTIWCMTCANMPHPFNEAWFSAVHPFLHAWKQWRIPLTFPAHPPEFYNQCLSGILLHRIAWATFSATLVYKTEDGKNKHHIDHTWSNFYTEVPLTCPSFQETEDYHLVKFVLPFKKNGPITVRHDVLSRGH